MLTENSNAIYQIKNNYITGQENSRQFLEKFLKEEELMNPRSSKDSTELRIEEMTFNQDLQNSKKLEEQALKNYAEYNEGKFQPHSFVLPVAE